MPFGLPNAADLNGIVANLGTIAASLGPEATAALQPIIEQIAGHADALEDKAIAAESTAEDKLLAELQAWRAELKPVSDLAASINSLVSLVVGAVTPKQ